MNRLWTYIDSKSWHEKTKYQMILLILGTVFALIGFGIWLLIRHWAFTTWDWMVCFIGYPITASMFVVFFYSCRHDFHDKCEGH